MYVELDGAWHPIADDEHTPCGLLIPFETPWTSEAPAVIHCGPDANWLSVLADAKKDDVDAQEFIDAVLAPEPVKPKAKAKRK